MIRTFTHEAFETRQAEAQALAAARATQQAARPAPKPFVAGHFIPEPAKPAHRLTPMTEAWSNGKTIFPTRVPAERAIDKDPATMNLAELMATQHQELPSISRQSWMLTGMGTYSIDRPIDGTGQTIAERIADDAELQASLRTTKPVTEMTVEELRALEKWHAENTRGSKMTPYKMLHPTKRRQIDWERYAAACSQAASHRYTRNHSGQILIEIRGVKDMDDKRYEQMAKAYLRALRDEWGHVPTLDEIEARGAEIRAIRETVGIPKNPTGGWYHDEYLMLDETDPYREDLFDAEAHSSYEYLADPDPIDEAFVAQNGLDPEDVLDVQPREPMIHFRSARDHARYLRDKNNSDALWHARIGEGMELGTDDSPQRIAATLAAKARAGARAFRQLMGGTRLDAGDPLATLLD